MFNPLLYDNVEIANRKLIDKIKNESYDLFFTNVCSPLMLYVETLQEIKKIGIPMCSFRSDNLVIPYHDKELAPLFDLVWLTSLETKPLYDKWGVRSIFLPYAANPYTFKPQYGNNNKICFIGTPYGSRPRMINILSENNVKIDIFCLPCKKQICSNINTKYSIRTISTIQTLYYRLFFSQGRKLLKATFYDMLRQKVELKKNSYVSFFPKVSPIELSDLYSEYSLSLSSTSAGHTDILKYPLKIINLRNFEIPMSGGIQICKYNEELSSYFEPNKEIIFYNSDEELVDKARFYTQHATDKEVLSIKKAARARAEAEHTWTQRFDKIFKIIGIR